MSQKTIGLIGRKVGMTQVFLPDGTMVGVSVVQLTPNTVTRLRTPERDGYAAVQLGAGQRRKLTKPVAGQLKDLPRVATIREFRLDDADAYSVGQTITVSDVFAEGDLVDVTGVSKGQGFAGTVKRHNFSRGPKTHGSDNYRKPGSIGPGTTPGRVYKGLKMGGHMGHERVTIKKLRVVRVDPDRNLILVKGAVPGAPGALTFVRKA
ncbi:MAG: 50S ribosomal protein L3 [Chloroflexi bacterium RBG_16_72_14]|nr:MAG: 50S ribosomal protein L3 [Chloroflexi bacterium RBG_16_72_14]